MLGAVVAVAVLAIGCSNASDPVAQRALDAPVRSTTTTAPPPPVLERLAVDPAVFGGDGDQRLVAVASGLAPALGRRLVAVGSADGRPAVWWSGDGRAWQRAGLDDAAFGPETVFTDVVSDPVAGGWAAVGADGDRAAAWVSADGERWARALVDDGPAMGKVAATGLGLVAVGASGEEAAGWQSYSGEQWVRAFGEGDVFTRPGPVRVVDVLDTGIGIQAVVEREGQGAEVWRSDDGARWSVAPLSSSALLPAIGTPVAAAASTLGAVSVVVGADEKDDGADAAMWLSNGPTSFEQVAHDEGVLGGDGDQSMTASVQAGDRLLVVGSETDEAGDRDAVVWASAPAGGLVRTADEAGAVPGDQHVTDVALLGPVPVAVGWEQTAGGADAVAWTVVTVAPEPEPDPSPAASLSWLRVTGQESLGGPGEQRLEAVVAGEGFLAVGSVSTEGSADADGAVWRSPDGLEWARVEAPALEGPGDQRLFDVAVGPAGVVAVGVDGESAAVWTSPDGATWQRVAHDEIIFGGPGDQRAEAVTTVPGGGGGWLAVGTDGGVSDGDAAVWRSSDGASWERVVDGGALGGQGSQIAFDVVAGPGGFIAVGTDGEVATGWTSADGTSWTEQALGGSGVAVGLGAGDAGLVAVGSSPGDGLDAVVWRSPDGLSWERDEGEALAGPLDQELAAVAIGEAMTVAVGRTNVGGGDDAAVWSSTEGSPWLRSAHDEELFGGDQAQRMVDVAVEGTTAVAVGWSGSSPASRDAAVWVSDLRGGGARANL